MQRISQPSPKYLAAYVRSLRPRQWTKNLIIFAAPLFAFQISLQSISSALLAFGLFCLTSSSFYLINDVVDVESDRQHPVKKNRPIAAGLVSIPLAVASAFGFLTTALIVSWHHSPSLGFTIASYAALQIAYNLKLKRTVLLDIIAIATGFVLRAYAGAAATDVRLSPWFLLCTALLALFLGIEKRKAELRLIEITGGKTRAVLQRYSLPLLSRMEGNVTTGTLITYSLWSFGPQVQGASTSWMLLTVPFVIYGIFRYQLLSDPRDLTTINAISRKHENHDASTEVLSQGSVATAIKPEVIERTERPEEVLLTDKPLLLNIVLWACTVAVILALKSRGIIQ
jgi:decaprenyl-phosphate phosphoribosyltransferase